jgi:hypothetical protein
MINAALCISSLLDNLHRRRGFRVVFFSTIVGGAEATGVGSDGSGFGAGGAVGGSS